MKKKRIGILAVIGALLLVGIVAVIAMGDDLFVAQPLQGAGARLEELADVDEASGRASEDLASMELRSIHRGRDSGDLGTGLEAVAGFGPVRGRVIARRDGLGVPAVDVRFSTENPVIERLAGWDLDARFMARFLPGFEQQWAAREASSAGDMTRTDQAGYFEAAPVWLGRYVSLHHPFYYVVPLSRPIFPRSGRMVEVELGARLSGSVSLARPAGDEVHILVRSLDGGRRGRGGGIFGAPSDPSLRTRGQVLGADGRFAFDGLPAGERYSVLVVAPGVGTWASPPMRLPRGEERTLDIAVAAGSKAEGFVHARQGGPIAKALLEVRYEAGIEPGSAASSDPRGGRNSRGNRGGRGGRRSFGQRGPSSLLGLRPVPLGSAKSRPDGSFTLDGLGDGQYSLRASAPGFVARDDLSFAVQGGISKSIDVALQPAQAIAGRVVRVDGAPVAGALVRTASGDLFANLRARFGRGGGGAGPQVETRSDEQGNFLLDGLPRRDRVTLEAITDDGLFGRQQIGGGGRGEQAPSGDEPVEITVAPYSSIFLQLDYPEGVEPAEEVRVTLMSGRFPIPQRTERFVRPPQDTAVLHQIEPGDYQIQIEAGGFAAAAVEVAVKGDSDSVEVAVPMLPGAEIHGLAVDQGSGLPVAGAEITVALNAPGGMRGMFRGGGGSAEPQLNRNCSARSDESGHFVLSDLAAGSFSLRGRHPEYPEVRTEELEVQTGQVIEEYSVTFIPGGKISGVVLDAKGLPRARLSVVVEPLEQGATAGPMRFRGGPQVRTDENGAYEVVRLAPGEYRIGLDESGGNRGGRGRRGGPSGASEYKTTTVLSGQVSIVDFRAETELQATLIGRVLRGQSPVGGGTARLLLAAGGRPRSARIDDKGVFRFEKVDLGTHRLTIESATRNQQGGRRFRGWGGSTFEVTLAEAGDTKRDFQLPDGVIAGLVRGSDGKPQQVMVRLQQGRDDSSFLDAAMRTSDSQGRFSFETLGEGTYRLIAESRGFGGRRGGRGRGGSRGSGAPGTAVVNLGPSQHVEGLVLELSQGGTLAFEAVDASGAPVPRARVTLSGADEQTGGLSGNGFAGGDGKGQVRDLAPGAYSIVVSATGFASSAAGQVVIVAGQETKQRLQLERGQALILEIADSEGKPVADAQIRIRNGQGAIVGTFPTQGGRRFGSGGGKQVDGIYAVGSFTAGNYTVEISSGGAGEWQSFGIHHAGGLRQTLRLAKSK